MVALNVLVLAAVVAGAGYFAYRESCHKADDELMLRIWIMTFIVIVGGYCLFVQFDRHGQEIMKEGNFFMIGSLFVAFIGSVAGMAAIMVAFSNATQRTNIREED